MSLSRTWARPAAVAVTLLPGLALAADNTSSANLAPIGINEPAAWLQLSNATTERWYRFDPAFGRSYCIELQRGQPFEHDTEVDPLLDVYEDDAATLIGTDDDGLEEPALGWGSRVCYIDPDGTFKTIRVRNTVPLTAIRSFQLRVVETTVFSPWYQVATAGGYDAAPQVRNTTQEPISVVFRARDAVGAGLPCTPAPTLIAPHGTLTFTISSRCSTASAFGGAEISHDGPPGGIVANLTTFSAASGLSFDAAFSPRQDW